MRYLVFRLLRYLLCAAFALGTPWATAGFMGNQIGAAYYYPDMSSPNPLSSAVITLPISSGVTTASPSLFTVGDGLETTVNFGPPNILGAVAIQADFSDTNLTLTFIRLAIGGSPSGLSTIFADQTFNGVVFTLVSGTPWDIEDFTLTSTVSNLGDFQFTHDAGLLSINLSNLIFNHNQSLSIDFTFADPVEIPEPAPITLLALGLLGWWVVRRRQGSVESNPQGIASNAR